MTVSISLFWGPHARTISQGIAPRFGTRPIVSRTGDEAEMRRLALFGWALVFPPPLFSVLLRRDGGDPATTACPNFDASGKPAVGQCEVLYGGGG